eukprot:m.213419 g.213419  ORF g.213419 m.213419 type:complete len:489 (-) comp25945_c0_seq1:254-1720(-)
MATLRVEDGESQDERTHLLNNSEKPGGSSRGSPWTAQLILAVFTSVIGGSFQFGWHVGVINQPEKIVRAALHGCDDVDTCDSVNSVQWSLIVSLFCIGGLIGSFTGKITNIIGRKKTMLVNNIFFISGTLMTVFAHNVGLMIAGRIFVGIGAGMATVVTPTYLGDIAPQSIRGAIGTLNQLGITSGILFSQLMGMSTVLGTFHGWRYLFALSLVFSGIQILLLFFLPESPVWLYLESNQDQAARDSLRKLRQSEYIHDEIDTLQRSREEAANRQELSLRTLINIPSLRMALIVGIFSQLAQQLSGINSIFYFSSSIFKDAGVSNPDLMTTMVGVINVFMTIVSVWLMDRAGRRTLLLTGLGGMAIFYAVLTLSKHIHALSTLAAISVLVIVIFFAIGPGPIPWLMVAEIFPSSASAAAVSPCIAANWLSNFAIGISFNAIKDGLGDNTFIPFMGLCIFFTWFVFQYCPETKGRSLEEITAIFVKRYGN